MPEDSQIYVRVEGKGGPSWRPVQAARVEENVYRILEGPGPGESWPFGKGDVVRCRPFELTDHDVILVAHELASGASGSGGAGAG